MKYLERVNEKLEHDYQNMYKHSHLQLYESCLLQQKPQTKWLPKFPHYFTY